MQLKRGFTILLILLFLATVTLSLAFIAENFHHDCTGNDCVICQMLETAEEILGGSKTEASAAKTVFKPSLADCGTIAVENYDAVLTTPVSLNDLLTI